MGSGSRFPGEDAEGCSSADTRSQPCCAGGGEPAGAAVPPGHPQLSDGAGCCSGHGWGDGLAPWLCSARGSSACPRHGPQDPIPSPGAAAGMYGERDEPLRPDPPPLQDPRANGRRGGWTEDGLRKATAPPPSLPGAGGGEGRGAGARTMGRGADSNSQFLVASSPPRAGAGGGQGRWWELTSLRLFLKRGVPGEHPPACARSHGQGRVAPGALAPGR